MRNFGMPVELHHFPSLNRCLNIELDYRLSQIIGFVHSWRSLLSDVEASCNISTWRERSLQIFHYLFFP